MPCKGYAANLFLEISIKNKYSKEQSCKKKGLNMTTAFISVPIRLLDATNSLKE